MQSFRSVHGIAPETHNGIERFASSLIAHLETHLSSHSFLLGEAPCRGDFSLYGPLWAHLYRDPHSRHLFDATPHVVRWFERLHGHDRDPSFTADAARAPPSPHGDFLPGDQIPTTLDPIFRTLFAEQWPFLASLSGAIDDHLDAHPEADRVPRALDFAPFYVGGAEGQRRLVTYQAWRLQRPLDLYVALTLAHPTHSPRTAHACRNTLMCTHSTRHHPAPSAPQPHPLVTPSDMRRSRLRRPAVLSLIARTAGSKDWECAMPFAGCNHVSDWREKGRCRWKRICCARCGMGV